MKAIQIITALTFILVIVAACNNADKGKTDDDQTKENSEAKSPENEFTVEGKALVFISPDSVSFSNAAAKAKKEYGEDGLAEIGSDEGMYAADAKDFVTAKGLKVFDSDAKVILFKKEDGSVFRFENKVNGLGADVYLFDGKKDPKKVEALAAFSDEKEYNEYFGIANLNPIIKQLQGSWAPVSVPDMPTETYEGDLVKMMPNQEYRVKLEGEYLVYAPIKNAEGGPFKRKVKKVTEKDFTYYEQGDNTLSKMIRPKK